MEGLEFPSLIDLSSPGHRRSQLVLTVTGLASTVLTAARITSRRVATESHRRWLFTADDFSNRRLADSITYSRSYVRFPGALRARFHRNLRRSRPLQLLRDL